MYYETVDISDVPKLLYNASCLVTTPNFIFREFSYQAR